MNPYSYISFIVRSSYREKVFKALNPKPIRPSEIAKQLDMRLTHVTRELRFLTQKKLAVCLNPKDRLARFYTLTDLGKKIKGKL